MALKRLVFEEKIPFSTTVSDEAKDKVTAEYLEALRSCQEYSKEHGLDDMALKEINEEIQAARNESKKKNK